jgi:putative transposase
MRLTTCPQSHRRLLTKLRWLYDGRNAEEGRRDLAAWLLRWQEKYPRLCVWAEET